MFKVMNKNGNQESVDVLMQKACFYSVEQEKNLAANGQGKVIFGAIG
jgi:hypothetical protein